MSGALQNPPFHDCEVILSLEMPEFSIPTPNITDFHLIPERLIGFFVSRWRMQHRPQKVLFYRIRDVYVAGEGLVFDRNLNLFHPSLTQHSDSTVGFYRDMVKVRSDEDNIPHLHGTALLCGKAGLNNYGHWLAEMLPLAWLSREWIRQDPGWMVLVPFVHQHMKQVLNDSLDLLGVSDSKRRFGSGEPVHVDELIFVTGLSRHGEYFPPLVIDVMDEISSKVWPHRFNKLWISRAGDLRSLSNEEKHHERIEAAGWKVIHPGQLTFREQIAYAKGATHMAGVNGAGLANLMFMRPGGSLTSFVPAVMPDVYYWQFAAHRGLTYREIRSAQCRDKTMSADDWNAPLTISIDNVLQHLHKVSGT